MKTPNILLINCDDLGYGDLGCYGSTVNDTPHLDQLANEGLKFTDFYMASPVCSASRAAMLTGSYPMRIGFGKHQVLFPGDKNGLHPEETTIAAMLKDVGYATKIIGKWHCGDQPEFLPTRHGFDEYFGIPYSNDMGRHSADDPRPPLPLVRNEEVLQAQPDQRGITERYVDEALQFLRKNQDQPFFLYLAHMYVHVPLFVPKQFLEASRNGAYGGAVAAIDWAMGALEAELERLGLKENTLVIFTSDNGSRARDEGGSNGALRGTKATTWEGGQRVPCIMRWPGHIEPGSTCKGLASSMDLLATFAEITGAPLPEKKTDSLSLASTMKDQTDTPRTSMAYYHRETLEAIRVGDWKLHFQKKETGPNESKPLDALFNLREDIGETTNLFEEHPDKVRELEAVADQIRQELGDDRLDMKGTEARPSGEVANPKPLTEYDESHPYMIAYYDLADMPTMRG